MWLTSVASMCTFWLMANAFAPLYTPRQTHQPACHQMPFAWIHMQICASLHVCLYEMLKHFGGHDLPLASRRISIILEKYTQSCNFPPLSFCADMCVCVCGCRGRVTRRNRNSERGSRRETETGTESERDGEERRDGDRQEELMVIASSVG